MNINDGVPSLTYQMIQIPPQPLNIFNYGVPLRVHYKARVENVFFEGNVFDMLCAMNALTELSIE